MSAVAELRFPPQYRVEYAGLDDILDGASCEGELDDGFTVRRAAQILDRDHRITTGHHRLFEQLSEIGWITRGTDKRPIPTDEGRGAGLFTRETVIRRGELSRDVVPQLFIPLPALGRLRRELLALAPAPPPARAVHPPTPPLFT